MASFHFSAQVLKRSKGHSAVAAAAYRARCQLKDERAGEVQDYRCKDGLHHTEIMLPAGAAPFLGDREQLWNHVEKIENRRDAQLARELNIALPHELNDAERLQLVRDFARQQFVDRGMVVDFAIHHPAPGGTGDQRNIHAHLMLTLRRATSHGLDRIKTRAWNSEELLREWRAAWAVEQNNALERSGHRSRVDHRTLEAQREEARGKGDLTMAALLDRAPEIHVGPRATAAAFRGRTPKSQERTARLRQRPRKAAHDASASAERTVRYQEIDKGLRRAWNGQLVASNRQRLMGLAEKRERQVNQFRHHEGRALRLMREIERELAGRTAGGRSALGFGKRTAEPVALLEARRARALGRANLARRLIVDIEKMLAQVLGAQRRQSERHRDLLRTWADDRLRSRGQSRERPWLG